jgi:excisionase family DNA binding protein
MKAETRFTTKYLANLFQVTQATICRWSDQGHIKCIRLPGGGRRFTQKEIDRVKEKFFVEK